jgi:hypothetical protein
MCKEAVCGTYFEQILTFASQTWTYTKKDINLMFRTEMKSVSNESTKRGRRIDVKMVSKN